MAPRAPRLDDSSLGLTRAEIHLIARSTVLWPGGSTVDLVGDVAHPAAVIQANAGDHPAYHLERGPRGYTVAMVVGDDMTTVGTFDTLDEALCSLGSVRRH